MNTCTTSIRRDQTALSATCKKDTEFISTNNIIGKGRYSTIYETCCGDNCNFILKWNIAVNVRDTNSLTDQIEFQQIAAEEGLSVPILEEISCDRGEGFVMERLNVTLAHELFTYFVLGVTINLNIPVNIINDTIRDQIDKKWNLVLACCTLKGLAAYTEIIHHDAHPGNLMKRKGEEQYYLIDFGRADSNHGEYNTTIDLEYLRKCIKKYIVNQKQKQVQYNCSYLFDYFPIATQIAHEDYHKDKEVKKIVKENFYYDIIRTDWLHQLHKIPFATSDIIDFMASREKEWQRICNENMILYRPDERVILQAIIENPLFQKRIDASIYQGIKK